MTAFYPEGVDAQGNEGVYFALALADQDAPAVTEVNATTSFALHCAVRAFSPNAEQGTSEDVRLCSREVYENPGRVRPTIDDVNYVYNPQTVGQSPADPDNKHYDTLKPGVRGYIIDRRGLDAREVAPTAGQLVDVYPVTCGAQRRAAIDPTAEGGKFEIVQKFFISGPPSYDVELV